MRATATVTAIALLLCCGLAQASSERPPSFSLSKALAPAPQHSLAALDLARVTAEDAAAEGKSRPWRYAVALPVSGLKSAGKSSEGGVWSDLPDGRKLWRFEVEAAAAKTVDLQFQPFRLPHGAELWVYTPDRRSLAGPYTEQHNNADLLLATPVLPGSRAIVEVAVPADRVERLQLALQTVHSGYRGFYNDAGMPVPKSGSCNVDTVCPQGDAFRNEIQAVARYTANGGLCTGTLMNNTAEDGSPLFLTARHCFSTQSAATGMVVYYNYASPTCRAVGSASSGTPLPINIASHTQTGATLLASATRADFTLVRLNQNIPSGANPYFAGWDRRNQAPSAATGIHHPQGDEKRISLENDPLTIMNVPVDLGAGLVLQAGDALRVADWDVGTTEQGSSGSALFSPQKLVVGVLSGGYAACGNNEEDYYGSMAASFTGGGTASSRLSNHLDPTGSGVQTLNGRLPGGSGGCSLAASITQNPGTAAVVAGTDVRFATTISGGTAPYSLSWDVDGDGVIDQERSGLAAGTHEILTRYNRPQSSNVVLRVSDAGGCQVQTQRAVEVDALALTIPTTTGSLTLTQQCGDGDGNVEPGEHWRLNINVNNSGRAAGVNAQAIFRRFSSDSGLRIVNPAVNLPASFPAGQSSVISTDFYIDPGTSCAAAHSIQLVGLADDRGVTESGVNISIPSPSACAAVTTCPAPTFASNSFRNGSYFNPLRSGNGLVSYLVPATGNSPQRFYAQWFTGDNARAPTWYYFLEDIVDGQAHGAIVKRTRNVSAPGFTTTDQVVGTGQVTVVGNERLVFTHQLDGKPRGGDKLVHLLSGLPVATPNRTGAWFFANESGWGQTYDSFVQSGNASEFVLSYVYDSSGQPRWVSSQGLAGGNGFEAIASARITCPTCAWVEPNFVNVGTITRQFSGSASGVLSTSFTVPGGGSWIRNSVPVQLVFVPQF